MNNRKAIFIDYDGTLYNHSINQISPKVMDVIKNLKVEDNIDLYLSTGRTYVYLNKEFVLLPYFKGLVSANGQFVKVDNRLIHHNCINHYDIYTLLQECEKRQISASMYTLDTIYIEFYDEKLTTNFYKTNSKLTVIKIKHLEDILNMKEEIYQICVFCSSSLIDELKPLFPQLVFYKWGDNGADVVSAGSNKGEGIKLIIEHEKYQIKNTYGIGDAENDILMFKNVGHAIAMGNAKDEIKAYAEYITDDINQEGLTKVILKIKNNEL